ncbi:nucleotidyltransferase domain-containing protein [Candidatus Roizmanbacteria bacterium]|nr:nucleotidyltransferase domain-containing protein [Candidatus Roizmanbacteria bacterium]
MKAKLFTKPLSNIFKNLPVRACYLYGSRAKNKERTDSDYDLAVFVEDKNKINYRDMLSIINANFSNPDKLHLTLVDLNSSSPLLLYQIIKNGQLLFEKQYGSHVNMESYVMRLFFDDQYRNKVYYQKLKKSYADR